MNCATHLEKSSVGMCSDCGKYICEICLNKEAGKMYCDLCARLKAEKQNQRQTTVVAHKSKGVAALLAFLLGGIGAHKFYLGQVGMGILYLLFCWTFIPGIAALFECIMYLTMSEDAFAQKYGLKVNL